MRVILRKLECIRTKQGEQTEEPYLCIYVDDNDRILWGPESMRDGDTLPIYTTDLVGSAIRFVLSEDDPGKNGEKYDDHLGGIELLEEGGGGGGSGAMSIRGPGSFILDLPRTSDGRYDRKEKHYKIYFDLLVTPEDHLPQQPYCLELISLHCINAQEWKDYVYLKVNGDRVFQPRRMRSGSIAQLNDVRPVPISYDTRIQLWEQDDSNRSDFFGEFRLWVWPGDYDFDNPPPPHRFHADEGIVGDATYILTYRVSERALDFQGNYVGCH